MLEGPVLSQVVPTVVLQLPACMTEPAYQHGRKSLRLQRGNPKPFVLGGFGLKLAPAVMVLGKLLFGAHHPYRLRVIGGERESLRIPELKPIALAIVLLGAAEIGGAAREQPHGGL